MIAHEEDACDYNGTPLHWTDGDEVEQLKQDRDILRAAICKTLDANAHLADGDNCALLDLKLALRGIGMPWDGDLEFDKA